MMELSRKLKYHLKDAPSNKCTNNCNNNVSFGHAITERRLSLAHIEIIVHLPIDQVGYISYNAAIWSILNPTT